MSCPPALWTEKANRSVFLSLPLLLSPAWPPPSNQTSALPSRFSWTQAFFPASLPSPVTRERDHAGCIPLCRTHLKKTLSSQSVWSQPSSYISLHLSIIRREQWPFVNWIRLHWGVDQAGEQQQQPKPSSLVEGGAPTRTLALLPFF